MTQSWEGRSKGATLGYRIFIGLIRMAGIWPAYFLLRFVSFYYFLFSPTSKYIFRLFRTRLGYGKAKALLNVYRNYYAFGQTLIDKIVVMSNDEPPYTFDFDGENHILDIIAEGKGGILISAHMGNYELAGHYFKRLPVKVNIVMVENEREQLKQYLDSVMQLRNLNIIAIKDDLSHIYEISSALKNNELIAIHGDRYVAGSRTVEANFMGAAANFPIGPFVLAATFKVPVSYVFCLKEGVKHYHLFASAPREYTGLKERAIAAAVKDYTGELEAKVRRYPTQWFNYYDFWQK